MDCFVATLNNGQDVRINVPPDVFREAQKDTGYLIKVVTNNLSRLQGTQHVPANVHVLKIAFYPATHEDGDHFISAPNSSEPMNDPLGYSTVVPGTSSEQHNILKTHAQSNAKPQYTAASERRSEWTSAPVKLLLQLRFEREAEFARPSCGKAKIWEKISKTMKDLYGYNFTGPDCSKKFSNLRTTYLTIRKRLRPTGASGDGKPDELDENDENDDEAGIMLDTKESDQGTKWEFYQIFRENFGSKASVEPGAHLLGATFNAAAASTNAEKVSENNEAPAKGKSKTSSFLRGKKRKSSEKPELTMKQYLHKKTENDESIMAKKLALKERQLELEERRLEAELKRTEAIAQLANSINAVRNNYDAAGQRSPQV